MNLSIEQARELGEALLDACENSKSTGGSQTVVFIDKQHAVAMPLDPEGHMEDVEYVVNVLV